MPALRQHMMAWRSDMHPIGRQESCRLDLVNHGIGRTVSGRLAADRVDATVGTAFAGTLHQFVIDIGLREIDGLGAARLCHGKPFRNFINRDDPASSQHQRGADGELSDRTAAPDRDRVARLDLRIDGGHVAGRKNVGQEQRLFVSDAVGNLDRADVGHRHAKIFGLAAGVAAEHVAESEQAGWRLPHRLGRQLGIRVRAVAARKQTLSDRTSIARN